MNNLTYDEFKATKKCWYKFCEKKSIVGKRKKGYDCRYHTECNNRRLLAEENENRMFEEDESKSNKEYNENRRKVGNGSSKKMLSVLYA